MRIRIVSVVVLLGIFSNLHCMKKRKPNTDINKTCAKKLKKTKFRDTRWKGCCGCLKLFCKPNPFPAYPKGWI